MRWFDFTGLQRHIKILGIFARLSIRDGKNGYLKDIPLTLKYIIEVGRNYPELTAFVQLLSSLSQTTDH
jgi:aminoglycoside/choline kinase family phosphotransferase